ncbi:MAG: hypothetical protein U1E21_12035 [Reyranellaceae bacterium]
MLPVKSASLIGSRGSDLFFAQQTQIDLTRARLDEALAAPQPVDA